MAERVVSEPFLPVSDQGCKGGFATASQTAQAGDAVTRAQDIINRPAWIFTEPVRRFVARMQRRDGIAVIADNSLSYSAIFNNNATTDPVTGPGGSDDLPRVEAGTIY